MEKKSKRVFLMAGGFLTAFVVWTVLVRWIDVQPIGPMGSRVGFATVNEWVHRITGVHWGLYVATDWLGLVPFAVVLGFAVLGLVQWIQRKRIGCVDRDLLVLGGFYAVVLVVYVFFELVVINYRPVLIEGVLEASYPSSTTMLALCVLPTAGMQLSHRIKNKRIKQCVFALLALLSVFFVVGRFFSGVHWASDIVGGALLSTGLVTAYRAILRT